MNEPIEQRAALWDKSIQCWLLDQLQILTQLRQTLLPCLMKGQLCLQETEAPLENAL